MLMKAVEARKKAEVVLMYTQTHTPFHKRAKDFASSVDSFFFQAVFNLFTLLPSKKTLALKNFSFESKAVFRQEF